METTNNSIKIVRLQSGEDIIATYHADDESSMVMLDRPMNVIFKRLPTGKSVMMMLPWLPVELIKENSAIINEHDILTIVDPREELIDYYTRASFHTDELLGDETVGESLMVEGDDELDDSYFDEEEEELSVEEMQEIMKEQKKQLLQ
jgi:hypothetical protein